MRFWSLFLLLISVFPLPSQAQDLRIALGMQDKKTLHGVAGVHEGGGLPAFNESLALEICRQLEARCVITKMKFAEILPAIEASKYDLGFGNFLCTPARDERVAFTDSIWRSSSRLVTLPAIAQHFEAAQGPGVTLDSLHDARIVAISNTQQYRYLQGVAKQNGLTVLVAETIAEAFVMLRQGQVDFHLLPMISAYGFVGNSNSAEASERLVFFGQPEAARGLGGTVHIALPKVDAALRLSVNKAIATLRADGSYHRLLRQYFPFNLE